MLSLVVLQADWKKTQERMKYRNTSLTAISKVVYRFDDTMILKFFFFYIFWWKQNLFRLKHHQSPETCFVFIKIFIYVFIKWTSKALWFIKATSYFVPQRSLGNTVIMSVSLIRHTTYCFFSTFHLCTGQNYFFYCRFSEDTRMLKRLSGKWYW